MFGRFAAIACAGLSLLACDPGSLREVRATGSSTVYPFTKAVADAFAKGAEGRKLPAIESVGTVAGINAFCQGAGYQHPDILDASRRLRRAEYDKCQANGVGEIIEVQIGLDGIALAESNAGPKLQLSRKDLYLALAANPLGKPNTAKTWRDVNPKLPAVAIDVLGPPATSGTRDAFVELMLEPGCLEATPDARELKAASDPALYANVCRALRSDGAYRTQGEDDTRMVEGLERSPNAIGLIGYSYLEENTRRLHGVPIEGVPPSAEAIASGQYPGVRNLYLYVKKKHLKGVPDLQPFLELYATMWAPGGPLAQHGLIPAQQKVRDRALEAIRGGFALDVSALP